MKATTVRVKALCADDIEEAAKLASDCMAQSGYYAGIYPSATAAEKTASVCARLRPTLRYCIETGGAFGLRNAAGELDAYEYMADYGTLKNNSPKLYAHIFDTAAGVPSFCELQAALDALLAQGGRVTYIMGFGIAQHARRSPSVLMAMARFNLALLQEKEILAADFTNKDLLSICALHGPFEIKKLAENYWMLVRR